MRASAALPLLWGCAHHPVKAPLERYDPDHGYRFRNLSSGENSDELFIALAFSGGGGRAAALSYGVLKQLRDTEVEVQGRRARLLDEVDVISAVSGGSFTAAYFVAHGEDIFETYEETFLWQNFQGKIVRTALSPLQWPRLLSPRFSLTDRAEEIYDKHLFHGVTYGDLVDRGQRPFLILRATDITLGRPFSFTQSLFDLLHSDLSSVSLARAVTASSAVPVMLNRVTLRNQQSGSGHVTPAWVEETLAEHAQSTLRYQAASTASLYLDPERSQHVRLVNGGVSDNLAVGPILMPRMDTSGDWSVADMVNRDRVRHAVIIVVNAANQPDAKWPLRPKPPLRLSVLNAALSGLISVNMIATGEILRQRIEATEPEHDVDVSLITVGFDVIKDPEKRSFFKNIATTLALSGETFDLLIQEGGPSAGLV